MEIERLTAVYDTDTRSFDRGVQDVERKLKTSEAGFNRTGRASKDFQGQLDSAGRSSRTFARDVGEVGNKASQSSGMLSRAASSVRNFTDALRGSQRIGAAGGFLPGLANISEIIQGIPQIGNLAGALVRPLKDATEQGVLFNAWLESTKIGFTTLMGGADAAQKHLDELRQYAIGKPFTFQGLVESSQYMQALGFDAREVIPSLTAIGDALSATGRVSQDSLEGVIRALGQMRAKGKVSAEEMNQLAERNINGFELLAKATGKSEAQLRKLAEAGRRNARVATELILKQIEREPKYAGAMERQAGTLNARLSDLEDLRQQALGRATEGLTRNLNESLGAALSQGDFVQTMAEGFNTALTPVSGVFRAAIVSSLEGGVTGALPDIYTLGKDLVAGTLTSGIEIGLEGGIQKILDTRRKLLTGAVGAVAGEGAANVVGSGLEKVDNAVTGGVKTLVGGGMGRFGIGPDALAEIESIAERAQRELGFSGGVSFIQGLQDGIREQGESLRAYLERLANDPMFKAFFEAIRRAEGGAPNRIVGGSTFSDFSQHPNRVGMVTSAGPSTAAGNWQITGTNWRQLAPKLGLTDFGVNNQMLAALELFRGRGGDRALLSGDIAGAIRAAGRDWAGVPGSPLPGREVTREQFMRFFNEALSRQTSMQGGILRAPISQPREQETFGPFAPFRTAEDKDVGLSILHTIDVLNKERERVQAAYRAAIDAAQSPQRYDEATRLQKRGIASPSIVSDVQALTRDLDAALTKLDEQILAAHERLDAVLRGGNITSQVSSNDPVPVRVMNLTDFFKPGNFREGFFEGFGPDKPQTLSLPPVKSLDELMRSVGAFTVPSRMFMRTDPDFGLGPPPVMLRPQATKQQQKEDFDRLVAQGNQTFGRLRQSFEDTMNDAFQDVFEVGFKRASANMVISFTQTLQQMAMQAAAAKIGEAIFGKATAEGQGDAGGLLGKLLGRLGIGEWGKRRNSGIGLPVPVTEPRLSPIQVPDVTGGSRNQPFTGGIFDEAPPIMERGFGNVTNSVDRATQSMTGAVNNAATQISNSNFQSAQQSANQIVTALTPQQEGFWPGLAKAALGGFLSGLTQGVIDASVFNHARGSQRPLTTTGGIREGAAPQRPLIPRPGGSTVTFPDDSVIDVVRRAAGGILRGPGTATSDSILAALSNGEFVMRARAVEALGEPMLNALNSLHGSLDATKREHLLAMMNERLGGLPERMSESVKRFAAGGIIKGPGTPTSDSILGVDKLTKQATAWVSRDEFVVNAKATNVLGETVLNALNSINAPSISESHRERLLGIMNERLGGLPERMGESVKRLAVGGMVDDRASYDWHAPTPSPEPPTFNYNLEPMHFDYGKMANAMGSNNGQQKVERHHHYNINVPVRPVSGYSTSRSRQQVAEAILAELEHAAARRGGR